MKNSEYTDLVLVDAVLYEHVLGECVVLLWSMRVYVY